MYKVRIWRNYDPHSALMTGWLWRCEDLGEEAKVAFLCPIRALANAEYRLRHHMGDVVIEGYGSRRKQA